MCSSSCCRPTSSWVRTRRTASVSMASAGIDSTNGDPFGISSNVLEARNELAPNGAVKSAAGEVQDALTAVYRVDFSPILDENDESVAIFQNPRVKMDIAQDFSLVIGFESTLYIAHLGENGDQDRRNEQDNKLAQLILVDGTPLEDSDEEITDVKWVDNELFAVSYSSGVLRIFSRGGKLHFAQKFHYASIVKLDVSANVSTKVVARAIQEVDMQSGGGELWVLYADGTVAIVQVEELLLRIRAAVYGPAQASKFRKYSLRDQENISAVAACGPARPSIFQSHQRLGVHTVVSVGSGPFLSFYQAGHDQNSIIHLAHIATAIASRAAGAVWSFAKSWGWSSGQEAPDGIGDADASGETRAIDAAAEHVAAQLGSVRAIPEDPRRRCRTMVLSPTGRLAAISDTLGRILLVDTNRMAVIRMWKGYRYAQCGWMHGVEGKRRSRGLYLVIYSAQRGIVEVWRTRYGPRVFSFAVGDNARLFSRYDAVTQSAHCLVLAGRRADGLTELLQVNTDAPSASILMKYFTQNKLQEENFVLHQIVGGLHAYLKKKRADGSHTLEQDALTSLLDDIDNLVSPTSIQALLDVLLVPDMATLSGSFVLKVLEKLHKSLRNSMEAKSPSGNELSLLWQLQWRQRIVSGYLGLHAEYHRSLSILRRAMDDKTATLAKHVTQDDDTGNARARLTPWLELYRRSGYNWSDDGLASTRQTVTRAAELTWWEFMECFSMPFNDAELPRRRDIVALYEQSETPFAFLRDAFDALKVPILRRSLSAAQQATLIVFLFSPALSNVFSVQELQTLHDSLLLTPATHASLFIDWYFMLPVGVVLAIPPPSLSCAFQRWLSSYIGKWDYERDAQEDEQDEDHEPSGKHRLASCIEPLAEIYRACVRSPRLVHAFVLSEHCRWGEQQQAKAIEEATLGRYSSVDGGLRWSILQDCLAKAVHVGLRLGRLGKLSVEGLELVDDVLRSVALLQLNEGYDLEDDDLAAKLTISLDDSTPSASGYDKWVASLEHCRTAVEMKSWLDVLQSYPQLASVDTVHCFRATLLCAAWNAERSDMHQLEDAIGEVRALSSTRLKIAIAVLIWERYIRVHVVTLITFWEESAAGRKPQRGLQPQIARRFFAIIKDLLNLLVAALKQSQGGEGDAADQNGHVELRDEDEDEDEDVDSDEELDEDRPATVVVECLTSRRRWRCPVRDLQRVFAARWPPSHTASSMMQSLHAFSANQLSAARLADHLSLVLLLDSFAATPITPVSIVKLFPGQGRDLCQPDSFLDKADSPVRNMRAAEKRAIHKERRQFLRQLLHHSDALGFALAEAFGLPTELIREEYVVFLYQSGRDEQADFSMDKMEHPERMVGPLGSIARARLSLILQRMKAEPEYAMVMSILPADVCMWVVADKVAPFVADPQVEPLDEAPSLTGTSMLLLRCLSLMAPVGVEFDKISAMSKLVKDIIARVKHSQGAAPQ